MECGSIYDDYCMTNVLLKDEKDLSTSEVFDSLWVSNSSPSFHDSASMMNFENIQEENNTESSSFTTRMGNFNNEFNEYLHQPAKKRRLSPDQVKFLEKSFEVENKLEPQRKLELANELGLRPRQIAIWFQNRRARCKTKILEKEYDTLKSSYDRLKADYETLCKENDDMKNEVNFLTEKLFMTKNGKQSDPISSKRKSNFSSNVETCKQEDAASSAKSDVFDSNDSPNHEYTDGNHSALLDSSHVFESDCSQDEDDRIFTKIEVECFVDDLQPNSCDLGFPVEDQGTWLWQ